MTRQAFFGLLFVVVGLALLGAVCAPVVVAIKAHGKVPDLSLPLVLAGLGTALFGAWLFPSSGVGATTVNILSVAGPYIPTFGRRVSQGEQTTPPKQGDV